MTRLLFLCNYYNYYYYVNLFLSIRRNSLLLTYLYSLSCLLPSFRLNLLILLSVFGKFIQTTLKKLLIFCQGNIPNFDLRKKTNTEGLKTWATHSGRSDQGTLNLIMKTHESFIFHTKININCKECYVAVILIFHQITPMYMPKNLENAPAQVFTWLSHWT